MNLDFVVNKVELDYLTLTSFNLNALKKMSTEFLKKFGFKAATETNEHI